MKLSFRLNGKAIALECEPADTLAEVLRNTLNLNGTKVSCEVQVCGACTVLVEGVPVSACTYLAYEARDKNVTTIEGLEKSDGTLHPLQQAFIDEFAFQCGYCRRHRARRRVDCSGVEKVSAEKKTDFHVVNHSLPRRDGRVKVTGKAQ